MTSITKKCNVTGKTVWGANFEDFQEKWAAHLAEFAPKKETKTNDKKDTKVAEVPDVQDSPDEDVPVPKKKASKKEK